MTTADVLQFTVIGVAQPKGSTRAFLPKGWKRPIVTSDNPRNKGWQQLIAESANVAIKEQKFGLLLGPVDLEVYFYLPRPKNIKSKSVPHVKKPDLDKLVRSVKDALTHVAWQDDAQVVNIHATKAYASPGEIPKVTICLGSHIVVRP